MSLVTVFIMSLAVSLAVSLFLFKGAADFVFRSLEKKIDIAVYFVPGVMESEITKIKTSLLELPGVKNVDYISADEALAQFKERQKNNDLIQQALEEVGENPFLASLNVQADDNLKYEAVNQFLSDKKFQNQVAKVDYFERKPVIDKFYSVKSSLEKMGLIFFLIFGFVAFAITFVTVRLAIYSSAEEIGIMRLVGASNWFIRGPFLVQGFVCGLMAGLVGLVLFTGLSLFASSRVFDLTGGFDLFKYFLNGFWTIVGLELLVGAGLGVVSSLVAVGRYLEK